MQYLKKESSDKDNVLHDGKNESLLQADSIIFGVFYLFIYLFILIGIHSMQGSTATMRHGVTRKRSTKRLEHTENLFRKNLQLKDVC